VQELQILIIIFVLQLIGGKTFSFRADFLNDRYDMVHKV